VETQVTGSAGPLDHILGIGGDGHQLNRSDRLAALGLHHILRETASFLAIKFPLKKKSLRLANYCNLMDYNWLGEDSDSSPP
jgi:hypothetical protein